MSDASPLVFKAEAIDEIHVLLKQVLTDDLPDQPLRIELSNWPHRHVYRHITYSSWRSALRGFAQAEEATARWQRWEQSRAVRRDERAVEQRAQKLSASR